MLHFRMVVLLALMCPAIAISVAVSEEAKFPYTAQITADNVYVRSGPADGYYPTDKLKMGDKVEVYRHDPGGWFAIRPPKGSFTWVSGRHLKWSSPTATVPGIATVRGDRVAARVGSRFSDIRDVIQVRLNDLEAVEVLEEQPSETGTESQVWYKIAPPSGEFRWVFGKYVSREEVTPGVRKTSGRGAPAGQRVVRAVATRSISDDHEPTALQRAEYREAASEMRENPQRLGSEEPALLDSRPKSEDSLRRQTAAPRPASFETPNYRAISPEEYQAQLEEIGLALSTMVVEEPTVWEFDGLRSRAERLLAQAETAIERGRARLLVNKITRFASIKKRYDQVGQLRRQTERNTTQLAAFKPAEERSTAKRRIDPRFDGVGQLAPVRSSMPDSPRYALLDREGKVQSYVTPAPGLNMRRYLGRRIGINGTRGYVPELDAQHVMARRISLLAGRKLQ